MAGLSDRMMAVAGMVTPGKQVADIGCDHAYTAIYLMEAGIAAKVIAMDIGAGPLEIAKKNIDTAGLSDRIETRLSDGFEKLNIGETDSAVIAGMGGGLIISILEKGKDIIVPGYELILSPQSDISEVRRYLRENGHRINKEIIIYDQGKMYNIMWVCAFGGLMPDEVQGVARMNDNSDIFEDTKARETNELFDEFGEYLLNHPTDIYKDYIDLTIKKKKDLIARLTNCPGESVSERLGLIEKELGMAEKARDYIEGLTYGKGKDD